MEVLILLLQCLQIQVANVKKLLLAAALLSGVTPIWADQLITPFPPVPVGTWPNIITGAGVISALETDVGQTGSFILNSGSSGISAPGGTTGQLQSNGGGSVFNGFTLAGDCTFSVPNITCLSTNGTPFGTLSTITPGTGVATATALPVNSTGGFALFPVVLSTVASNSILSNISGSTAVPIANTPTSILDFSFGGTQGNILYRGASTWSTLAPGAVGTLLSSNGPATNPSWINGAFLPITGGTLTGNLSMSSTQPLLALNKSASGQYNLFYGETNGLLRWQMLFGDNAAETGGNTGSNFDLNAINDAGNAAISTPISINRASGITNFSSAPTFPTVGVNSNTLQGATTNWVQAELNNRNFIPFTSQAALNVASAQNAVHLNTTAGQSTWNFAGEASGLNVPVYVWGTFYGVGGNVDANNMFLFNVAQMYVAHANNADTATNVINTPAPVTCFQCVGTYRMTYGAGAVCAPGSAGYTGAFYGLPGGNWQCMGAALGNGGVIIDFFIRIA